MGDRGYGSGTNEDFYGCFSFVNCFCIAHLMHLVPSLMEIDIPCMHRVNRFVSVHDFLLEKSR